MKKQHRKELAAIIRDVDKLSHRLRKLQIDMDVRTPRIGVVHGPRNYDRDGIPQFKVTAAMEREEGQRYRNGRRQVYVRTTWSKKPQWIDADIAAHDPHVRGGTG